MDAALIQEQIPLVLVQMLAFICFVWLLKRFATEPVLRLLDERREKITREFDLISASEKRLEMQKQEFEDRLARIDEEAKRRTQEETNRSRRIADEIVETARSEALLVSEKTRSAIQLEVDRVREQLRSEMVSMAFDISQRILREKIDESEHARLVDRFVEELEQKN